MTSNEELFDALIRHQIGLLRLDNGIASEAIKVLNATERAVRRELARRLPSLEGMEFTPHNIRRLRSLEKALFEIRSKAFGQVTTQWQMEFADLILAEGMFIKSAIEAVVPVILDVIVPPAQKLKTLLTAKPFEGRVLLDWAKNLQKRDLDRLTSRIRIGLLQGETTQQITRGVLGTTRLRGKDGIMQITRRQVHAVTRTATNFYANQARREVMGENLDIITAEQYVATLDDRTTLICAGLDGKQFKPTEGPYPPVHFQCRSTRIPIIGKDLIGERPFKKGSERQFIKEYSKKAGLGTVKGRDGLPRGHKGKYDAFARQRGRELTGTVPAKTTFDQFLRRQSAAWQDEYLGSARGALYRRGGLKLERFTDKAGRRYTLDELKIRDRQAFEAANLL